MTTKADVTVSPPKVPRIQLTPAQRRNVIGYIFISPFVLGFLFWWLAPALASVYLTFQRWNLISPPRYIGLANIEHLFNDPLLPQSLKATILFTFLSVPLTLILGFFLAML
ncbi:MAG: sugar ABC transporter permease, partial [Anaerolineae bacterium]|nr:sugar ABC transporter permease [Anaerolineae bacterium]